MARGKEICRILKEIRRQIAEANDIEFIISECRYKSDCLGTCPKCEAEVHYLEQQLRIRSLAGKVVVLAGVSAGIILMSSCSGTTSKHTDYEQLQGEPEVKMIQTTDSLESPKSKQDDIITEEGEIILEGDIVRQANPDEYGIYEKADKMPEFPGGQDEMFKFLQSNLKWPKELDDGPDVQGRVIVRFWVDTIGKIHDIKVIRGIHPALNKEAVRVVKLLPDFIPGEIYEKGDSIPIVGEVEGKKVNTYFTIPVLFRLQ